MWILKMLTFVAVFAAGPVIFCPPPASASDPLEDTDGTEGWDQVVQPPAQRQRRDVRSEREAFRREVADWESVRQLWQRAREGYIAEKTNHRRLSKQLRKQHRSTGSPGVSGVSDSLYEDEWGDQPGQALFESTGSIDRAIDSELEDTGSAPAASAYDETENYQQPIYTPIPKVDPEQERLRRIAEQEARRKKEAAARQQLAEMERRRQAENERRRQEEEERKRKEAEAAAGAAAAEMLLKQQEEMIRKEQEAIRKKAKLDVDQEGQVVDPELRKEIDEDEEEQEDD